MASQSGERRRCRTRISTCSCPCRRRKGPGSPGRRGPHFGVVRSTPGPLRFVVGPRPERLRAGGVGELMKRELGTGHSPLPHFGFTALLRDRSHAREFLDLAGVRIAMAESEREAWRRGLACTRQALVVREEFFQLLSETGGRRAPCCSTLAPSAAKPRSRPDCRSGAALPRNRAARSSGESRSSEKRRRSDRRAWGTAARSANEGGRIRGGTRRFLVFRDHVSRPRSTVLLRVGVPSAPACEL